MSDGQIVQKVVEYIVTEIVEDSSAVKIDLRQDTDDSVTIEVRTAEQDMGSVIGKRGRVARAIRVVAQAAAEEEGLSSSVEFID